MSTGIEDELTGLHNRRSFLSLLRRHIGLANDHRTNLGLVVLDIDGFARINASHGYAFGDQVLQHLAQQLRQVTRNHDYAARLGDNRFALLLTRVMNKGHVELAIRKLFRCLDVPFESGQTRLKLPVTAGAALCPTHATHADYLLRQAEVSLATARALGQPHQFAPDHEKDTGLSKLWDLEIELAGAAERGELALHYQPKLRTRDRMPIGAEALMRWHHRGRGTIAPDLFIPVAEQTGHIRAMTVWALNTALRQAADWRAGPMSVAVNVPATMLARHDLPDLVENALNLWGRDHVQLVLEITERSLVSDPIHCFRILSRIREMGVRISIDDFGTGYSCLAYFKDIPADELKIDRSFVSALLTEPASADITWLIIDLAHRFGLSVVAEGVEDEYTLQALAGRGCDIVQGHLFAAAMPPDTFRRWIASAAAA
jgi:diguanylate cyclase (GGDEF)-like protein